MDVASSNPGDIFSCPECGIGFMDRVMLQAHTAMHQLTDTEAMKKKNYACGCGRSFPSPAQLESHKKTHPGYAVGKKTKKKKNKKQSHVGIRCPVCELDFESFESLSCHPVEVREDQLLQSQMNGDHPSQPHPGKKKKKKKLYTRCVYCGSMFALWDLEEHRQFCYTYEVEKIRPPSISGKSDVMVNQRRPKSVFFMAAFNATHYGALYEIELDKLEKLEENEGKSEYTLPLLDPLLEFFDKSLEIPKYCIFHGARFGSRVYIILNEIKFPYCAPFKPTDAFWFDMRDLNSKLQRFSPPRSPKTWCAVISAYGKLYYLAEPSCFPYIKKQSFECYDPIKDSWESLPPYPWYSRDHVPTMISGHAVFCGYLLISMNGKRKYPMVAFHIATKTWHHVELDESMKTLCDSFWGRAVVLGKMIYSMSSTMDEVIVFSFYWDSSDDDNVALRKHYVGSRVSLYVDDQACVPDFFEAGVTQNLIHLGGRDFCLLQTGRNYYSLENQYVCATTIRIAGQGQEMFVETLHSRTFRVALNKRCDFLIDFSFTSEIEPEEESECNS